MLILIFRNCFNFLKLKFDFCSKDYHLDLVKRNILKKLYYYALLNYFILKHLIFKVGQYERFYHISLKEHFR